MRRDNDLCNDRMRTRRVEISSLGTHSLMALRADSEVSARQVMP